ncbi:MAG: hypothetical protein H5T32_07780 [Candidatus Methanosuratus sp.]|nr:hypothetical protein [Candidatus Methanosuratincola sp.]
MTAHAGKSNPYALGLVAFGSMLAGFSWLVLQSTPMTALGIGAAVVGASIAITPTSPVPSGAVRKLLEGSLLNIEAVLEDTGAVSKAYYVPDISESGALVRALIPLGEGSIAPPPPNQALAEGNAGLVATAGGAEYLVVYPPGALLLKNEELGGDLESALIRFLVEESGLVESVKATEDGDAAVVEFAIPRSRAGSGRVRQVLGSLESGTAAAILAALKKAMVTVASEEDLGKGKKRAVLRMIRPQAS